jgi:hypothetical protein
MSVRSVIVKALCSAFLVVAASNTAGAAPLFSITNTTGLPVINPPFTLGFEFTATSTFLATELGFFDSGLDGLVESHQVGLWTNGGTLLAAATVPSGVAAPLLNGFRYVPIAPVLITPGNYRAGALILSPNDAIVFTGNATGFATIPGIAFVTSRFDAAPTLVFPFFTVTDEPGYFGPNVNLNGVAVIPEPLTLALVASGLAGAFVRRRTPRLSK